MGNERRVRQQYPRHKTQHLVTVAYKDSDTDCWDEGASFGLRRLYANNTHAQRCVRVENQPGKRIDITEDFQIVEAKDCRKRILKSGARAPLDRRRALTA